MKMEGVMIRETCLPDLEWMDDHCGIILQATKFADLVFSQAREEIAPTVQVILNRDHSSKLMMILTPNTNSPEMAEMLCTHLIQRCYLHPDFMGAILNTEGIERKMVEGKMVERDVLLQLLYLRDEKLFQFRVTGMIREPGKLPIRASTTILESPDFYLSGPQLPEI